jgi:hypothetical protein
MSPNPYESPRLAVNGSAGIRNLLFRGIAVVCWVFALLLLLGFLSIIGRVEVTERFEENPVLAITVTIVGIALPAMGLMLLGLASWRRSGWLALAGTIPFLAMITWFLAVFLLRLR